jgi:hypothetical protein
MPPIELSFDAIQSLEGDASFCQENITRRLRSWIGILITAGYFPQRDALI